MYKTLTLILLLFFVHTSLPAEVRFRVMFYNVENLFDTSDHPQTDDNEFLPQGNRHWTYTRYKQKLQQLSKVILAASEWQYPALIGLCEVENEVVVQQLISQTALHKSGYQQIITDGIDPRGIEVGLLYQPDQFSYLDHRSIRVQFSGNPVKRSRDLLHVWGLLNDSSRLDVLVCHAPSRYGGEKETESARECLALTIRAITDSLHQTLPRAQLILMGDFNDTPDHRTIQQTLGALPLSKISSDTTAYLINLFDGKRAYAMGSHKYNSFWSQLDQLILSRNLVDSNAPFYYQEGSAHVFAPDFLLKSDPTHGGKRPFRTYYGFRYEGGFSDHLPVIADFLFRKDATD